MNVFVVIVVDKKKQFFVVLSVVKKRQFLVAISVGKEAVLGVYYCG